MNNQKKWTKAITRLETFRNLQDNYDGEGSKAPNKTTLDNTHRLLHTLTTHNIPPPQFLTLWIKGEIFLEWIYKSEWLDIEIKDNNTLIGRGKKDQQTQWSTPTIQELIETAHLLNPPTKQQPRSRTHHPNQPRIKPCGDQPQGKPQSN